ncbi:MAG: FtsX-like permease family protein [Candidatus Thorarchaeota archaeon]|nr:FtsX-like permease family protein [Candidatus Thorarchaeota archaeon]
MGRGEHKSNGHRGNRLYALSYAMGSLKSYPFRALSLALTLSLGLSLVGSVLIWADTGLQVSVDEFFDSTSFQMAIEDDVGMTEMVDAAEAFVASNQFIQSTHRVYSTVGLVYGTHLPDSTEYGLAEPVYTDGIKDCEVMFVDNEFLTSAAAEFSIEGRFELHTGEVLVSRQFVSYVYEVFGTILTVNSTIDIEVLGRRPIGLVGTIGNMQRTSLEQLRVVGLYEIEGHQSIMERILPSIVRDNYDYVHFSTPVLGIRDSIMVLSDAMDISQISEEGFFGAQAFIRASSTALTAAGVQMISETLLTLKARIEEQFRVNVEGLEEILHLQNVVNAYISNTALGVLNLPVFVLALFLSVFAADTFLATRAVEISALRSKGASSTQVYGIFISEAFVVVLTSIGLGLFLSVFTAALISSATGYLMFDWSLYEYYLASTVLKPSTVLLAIAVCILPPLLLILNSARKAAMIEIGSMLMDKPEEPIQGGEAHRFTIGSSIVLLVMVIGAALYLPANPLVLIMELSFGTAAWFFMAYNGSRYTREAFARVSARLAFILGEKCTVAASNLRMRRGRIVPLMVVLVLTLSSTIAFTVQVESFQTDLRHEVDYAIGADMRVASTPRPFSFSDVIEAYPGVNLATPVLSTFAQTGSEKITIEGIDALEYSVIAHFDSTSFYGKSPVTVLSRLAQVPNGIVLSARHAQLFNRTVGDSLTLLVGGKGLSVPVTFEVVDFVYSCPGFGYASKDDMPVSAWGAGFGYQAPLSGFALTNIEFLAGQTSLDTASLFLVDLACITNHSLLVRGLSDLPGVNSVTSRSFNLKSASFGTALFLSTVEGLSSIGFVMSLVLSMFSLTLFLGSIVGERTRDYAILRAVGSSKRQLTRLVFSEFTGVVAASLTLSVLLGTTFGYVLSVVVFSMSPFSRALEPLIVFPVGFLTAVLLTEMCAMIVGAYFPARRASKTDPAIVLRNL